MNEPNAEYDNTWKEAIGEYFESFLEFFFPQVHAFTADSGLRLVDKLFQVWRHGNEPTWILIHIEIQSQEESNFAKRMYMYNYRAFDLYERPVVSLAVLGDEQTNWRPLFFGYTLGGCEVSLKFPIVKLLDCLLQWQDLEQNNNPFAIIAMAHLKTKATTGKPREREEWKWSLVRGLYDRGYDRENIIKLFQVIDRMMALPEELQQSFEQKITSYEEERKMPLLSRMEERGLERGIQQTQQILRASIINILQIRFEILSPELIAAINRLEDILTNLVSKPLSLQERGLERGQ